MNEWIYNNLHTDLIKYITDSQMYTTNNTRQTTNELTNKGLKTDSVQYYNTHQGSILLDLVTGSDIYNNYSHVSCVDWKIKKTPIVYSRYLIFT